MKNLLAASLLLLTSCATMRSTSETGFLNRTVDHAGRTYRYVVYVPDSDRSRILPVVLFLHGAGERGDDGLRQTAVGLGSAIRWSPERFPMIVVMPQAPAETRWLADSATAAMMALDAATREFRGDPSRTYLTGLSLGGYGTWHLAMAHPGRFAALVPVCGGILKPETADSVRQSPLTASAADPYAATAERVSGVPVWIFHGAEDKTIPASESRRMYAELQKLGADVRYTEFPGVGHNAWDPAYGNGELWTWLLAQRR